MRYSMDHTYAEEALVRYEEQPFKVVAVALDEGQGEYHVLKQPSFRSGGTHWPAEYRLVRATQIQGAPGVLTFRGEVLHTEQPGRKWKECESRMAYYAQEHAYGRTPKMGGK